MIVFKTVLRGLWTFGFVGLKIVFWVLFVELGGLLTPSDTKLFLVTSHLVNTLVASPSSGLPKSLAQVTSVLPSPTICGLSYIRVHSRLEDNS